MLNKDHNKLFHYIKIKISIFYLTTALTSVYYSYYNKAFAASNVQDFEKNRTFSLSDINKKPVNYKQNANIFSKQYYFQLNNSLGTWTNDTESLADEFIDFNNHSLAGGISHDLGLHSRIRAELELQHTKTKSSFSNTKEKTTTKVEFSSSPTITKNNNSLPVRQSDSILQEKEETFNNLFYIYQGALSYELDNFFKDDFKRMIFQKDKKFNELLVEENTTTLSDYHNSLTAALNKLFKSYQFSDNEIIQINNGLKNITNLSLNTPELVTKAQQEMESFINQEVGKIMKERKDNGDLVYNHQDYYSPVLQKLLNDLPRLSFQSRDETYNTIKQHFFDKLPKLLFNDYDMQSLDKIFQEERDKIDGNKLNNKDDFSSMNIHQQALYRAQYKREMSDFSEKIVNEFLPKVRQKILEIGKSKLLSHENIIAIQNKISSEFAINEEQSLQDQAVSKLLLAIEKLPIKADVIEKHWNLTRGIASINYDVNISENGRLKFHTGIGGGYGIAFSKDYNVSKERYASEESESYHDLALLGKIGLSYQLTNNLTISSEYRYIHDFLYNKSDSSKDVINLAQQQMVVGVRYEF